MSLSGDITVLALCLAGFGAGFVDAIAGGGGLVTVPSLMQTGLAMPLVLGTNKGQAVFGAVASFVTYYRKGALDKSRITISFIAAFVGSLLGARLLLWMPSKPLKPLVLALLVFAMVAVLIPRKARAVAPEFASEKASPRPPIAAWILATIALALGAYDGFFGPGTGSILIALYMRVCGDEATRASGNAKVANLASNLAAMLTFAWRGDILWHIALPMALANALGATLGARAAIHVGASLVRFVLVAVVLTMLAKLTYELLH